MPGVTSGAPVSAALVLDPPTAILAIAVMVAVAAVRRARTDPRFSARAHWAVGLYGLSCVLWQIGAVLQHGSPGERLPTAELFGAAGSLTFFATILFAVYVRGRPTLAHWLDSVVFVCALIVPLWLLIDLTAGSHSPPWPAVWAASTLVTLFAGGVFVMSGGPWNRPAVLWVTAVVCDIAIGGVDALTGPITLFGLPTHPVTALVGAICLFDPKLPATLTRGGRPDGLPLSTLVWMLVGALALPVSALAWCYINDYALPTGLVLSSFGVIVALIALRAGLMARQQVPDWSVPLMISASALFVAGVAIALTELGQAGRASAREAARLEAIVPEVRGLDALLLRATAADAYGRAEALLQWHSAVSGIAATPGAPRSELATYVTTAQSALTELRPGESLAGQPADARVRQAERSLASALDARVQQRRADAARQSRLVREVTVAAFALTLLVLSILLLRFNRGHRRIELEFQRTHDALTGLPNRIALEQQILDAPRAPAPDSWNLVLLDLDDFKAVNDSLGHHTGNSVLRTLATRLENVLDGDHDLVRFDGDAFAVLVRPGHDPVSIARRLLGALREPIALAGSSHAICASVGIARIDDESPERHLAALRDAELAMYDAKSLPGSSIETYAPGMHERARDRVQLAADLRNALDGNGLHLVYQPIVDLGDGTVRGYEALLRWTHPTRGPMSPAEFIPIAERSELIVDLGEWVLREATAHLARWQARWNDDRYVTVNVAAAQLSSRALAGQVHAALAASGLGADQLVLEVTESSLISDIEASLEQMHEIRSLGTRFALDDFGTGYSSLSYLQRFPVDVLKVDKAFIDALNDRDGGSLVRAIIHMGESLRMRVVAEGIEDPAQAAFLCRTGCDLGQGYYFSRPLPADQIAASPRELALPTAQALRVIGS